MRGLALRVVVGLAVIAGLGVTGSAVAGTISISTGTRMVELPPVVSDTGETTGGGAGIEVTVANGGDEAARNVQAHLTFLGKTTPGEKWDKLDPKEEKTYVFPLQSPPDKPGIYPALLTVEFADLNLYPFTALNLAPVPVGPEYDQAKVFGKINDLEFKKSGLLEITIKNENDAPKTITGTVFGPREYVVEPKDFTVELGPNEQKTHSVRVENFSARADATYTVFVALEYDDAAGHYTFPLAARTKVLQGGMTPAMRNAIIGAAAGVLVIAIGFEVMRRSRRRR
ncbi:hypothetical protein K8I61_14720 [bacterium]|nr:hypothetical protein [bacterium]